MKSILRYTETDIWQIYSFRNGSYFVLIRIVFHTLYNVLEDGNAANYICFEIILMQLTSGTSLQIMECFP